MNVVFWLYVVLILFVVWICLSSIFKSIGGIVTDKFEDIKKELSDESSDENTKERKEEVTNEEG